MEREPHVTYDPNDFFYAQDIAFLTDQPLISRGTVADQPQPSPTHDIDEDLAYAIKLQEELNQPTSSPAPAPSRPAPRQPSTGSGFLSAISSALLPNTCAKCSRTIFTSSMTKFKGPPYHSDCLRCDTCQERITGVIYTNENGMHHERCYKEIYHPRCCVCNNRLPETENGIEWRCHPFFKEDKFCASHTDARTCCACHRIETLAQGHTDLSDGRFLCGECVRTVVVDSDEAAPIYVDVLMFLKDGLGLDIPKDMRNVPVLAVDMPTLNDRSRQERHHTGAITRGLCLSEVSSVSHMGPGSLRYDPVRGRYVGTGSSMRRLEQRAVTAILVLYGLPRDLFASILAHEAMHAWLRLNPSFQSHLDNQVMRLCDYGEVRQEWHQAAEQMVVL